MDRLGEFVLPYQHALETEAGGRQGPLYPQGLLSPIDRQNAEKIAALVDVERQVLQDFIGTASWDHRPLLQVLVGQVVDQWLTHSDSDPGQDYPTQGASRFGLPQR